MDGGRAGGVLQPPRGHGGGRLQSGRARTAPLEERPYVGGNRNKTEELITLDLGISAFIMCSITIRSHWKSVETGYFTVKTKAYIDANYIIYLLTLTFAHIGV